jgi:branched-chain amino acid transport system ATP-binding protein
MLEVTDLHVSYGVVEAVRGVSLSIEPGRITLILGANGAGKTSTLRGIAGLLPLNAGKVRLGDTDVAGLPAHRIAKRGLALVPEGRRVFAPLTVEENLRLGAYVANARDAAETLVRVYDMFPILKERRRGQAGLLSGGEQQMLAFGRALMSQPKVVLMDEPSMGLAPAMIDTVFGSARDIAESGIGVLMVEQNAVAGMSIADTVCTMSRGELAFTGTVEEANANTAVLQAFLGEAALAD